MTERGTAGGLDLEALRRAHEEHDLKLMVEEVRGGYVRSENSLRAVAPCYATGA